MLICWPLTHQKDSWMTQQPLILIDAGSVSERNRRNVTSKSGQREVYEIYLQQWARQSGHCVFTINGMWYNSSCSTTYYFFCYTWIYQISIVQEIWQEALTHCRRFFTDLLDPRDSSGFGQKTREWIFRHLVFGQDYAFWKAHGSGWTLHLWGTGPHCPHVPAGLSFVEPSKLELMSV